MGVYYLKRVHQDEIQQEIIIKELIEERVNGSILHTTVGADAYPLTLPPPIWTPTDGEGDPLLTPWTSPNMSIPVSSGFCRGKLKKGSIESNGKGCSR
jgi:hypothetical protein